MSLRGILTSAKEAFKRFKESRNIRNGSKVAICWLIFSGLLILWMLIGIPIISIYYPHLVAFFPNLDKIIIALVGGSSFIFSTVEVRKTVENIKIKKNE